MIMMMVHSWGLGINNTFSLVDFWFCHWDMTGTTCNMNNAYVVTMKNLCHFNIPVSSRTNSNPV